MSKPFRIYLLGVAVILTAILFYQMISRRQPAPVQTSNQVMASSQLGINVAGQPAVVAGTAADRMFRLRPDQVLATVNGHEIKLADVIPVSTNGNPQSLDVSGVELKFLLKRAVDRELIFQTAKKQGLALNDSEQQQLASLNSMRGLPEPGGIAKLNSSGAQRNLEMQDAQAFMLQTELMAAQGASPNVTEGQVTAYYQAHQSEYGELPTDEAARSQAWAKINFSIREQLAPSIRSSYNDKLTAYMKLVEASANIAMTPLDQTSSND